MSYVQQAVGISVVGVVVIYMIFLIMMDKISTDPYLDKNATKQPIMVCYSALDVYEVADYELPDEKTLITSHGRVYNIDECREK